VDELATEFFVNIEPSFMQPETSSC